MDETSLKRVLAESGIPEHNWDGLVLYLLRGIRPGSFLEAVLKNVLSESVMRADMTNAKALSHFVSWMIWECPANAWGSESAVEDWIAEGGLEGKELV